MLTDWLELGPTPPEEDCAQLGTEGYTDKASVECRRYIEAIRAKLGTEPRGASLQIRANQHDFGTYYEVACLFREDWPEAVQYAFDCEAYGPETWDDTDRLPRCPECHNLRKVCEHTDCTHDWQTADTETQIFNL